MPRLNQQQKVFIIERLACFESATEVQAALKETFGLDVPLPQLSQYNPETAMGQELSAKLKTLFADTRKRFIEDTSNIPIAHKAVRLRRLSEMLAEARKSKNHKLAAQLLEQAAKEAGGAFTNKREISGPGGGPVEVKGLNDFYSQG